MSRMRAVVQHEFGGPEVLRLEDVEVPEPLPTEVQVRVGYAGVNPVDAKTREGASVAKAMGGFPITVGWDVAGTVSKVGVGVTRFAVGDRVYGMPRFPRACGAYAEYVTAPSRQLVAVPDNLGLAEAAAVPLPATTAYQIVTDVAAVTAGRTVLILGAAGSVGRFAVQIAKSRGARVVGTDGAGKLDDLAAIGADLALDYRTQDFADHVGDVDVVIDFVGGGDIKRAISVTRPGGLVVSVPSGDKDALRAEAAASGVRLTGLIVEPDRTALEYVSDHIAAGAITVPAPRVRDLTDVVAVHRELARGMVKTVLRVAG